MIHEAVLSRFGRITRITRITLQSGRKTICDFATLVFSIEIAARVRSRAEAYLRKISPMTSTEIALSKHMTYLLAYHNQLKNTSQAS